MLNAMHQNITLEKASRDTCNMYVIIIINFIRVNAGGNELDKTFTYTYCSAN